MVKSAYIHIPFCRSKCHYCSFVSFPDMSLKNQYLTALKKEISVFYNKEVLSTLYFGGGTPSILAISEIEDLLSCLKYNSDTELTIELNPDDVSYDYLRGLYDLGVNRLSFGCQTFNDEILKLINRRHTSSQVIDAVHIAHEIGFGNISLDFIYGLPNQTPESFYDDLEKAVSLGVEHISLYGLTIDEGCYFAKHRPSGVCDEDSQADMYLGAVRLMTELAFEHYEISNFSCVGYNSKHNMNYWNNGEYYGFGLSSHGYVDGIRYGNKVDLEGYIKEPTIHLEEKFITQKEKLEEEIFLGFRRISGVNVGEINSKFGIDFEEKYNEILKKYEGLGLLKKTKNGFALTPNGILVSNTILSEFI